MRDIRVFKQLGLVGKQLIGRVGGATFSLILLMVSATLFALSAENINLGGMNDLGLVSVLPPMIYVSLLILTFSFIYALHWLEYRSTLLLLHIALLIVILFGVTVPAEEVPRFNVTWRHVGIIDYILRNHTVDPRIDAYFNWPGFFSFMAFVMEIMGLKHPISLVFWPSVFNNLLYLAPLLLILRSVTDNQKLVWYGLWIFYLANWIGQDYFAPQALNYFLYIAILGILLWSFRGTQAIPWLERLLNRINRRAILSETQEQKNIVRGRNTARRQRLVGLLVILLAAFFSVVSHQLTPFAILISVAILSVFNQISARGLGYIITLMIAVWLAYMAVAYLQDRASTLLGNVGQVDQAVTANVTARLSGSPGHHVIVKIRLWETILIWGLAILGGIRRIRQNYFDLLPVLLALLPFTLLMLQFYGGEMLLRVYYFTLPFMAFFISGLLYTNWPKRYISWQPLVAGLLSLMLIGSFFLSRYGNEKIDQFTQKEVDAVSYVYKIAEPGSLIAAPSPHYPIQFDGYEIYSVKFFAGPILADDVDTLIINMEQVKARARFFVITTSQESYFHMFYNFAIERWPTFEAKMVASGRFELIYSNEDAKVYKLLNVQ